MKITKIKLHSYLHFKNGLEIPLTYPKGHDREGKPLQKVCFLGQSATGKTTLLNVIKYFVCEGKQFSHIGIDDSSFVSKGVELFYQLGGKSYSKISAGGGGFEHFTHEDGKPPTEVTDISPFYEVLKFESRLSRPLLINFPFCVVGPVDAKDSKTTEPEIEKDALSRTPIGLREVWDFDSSGIRTVWKIVFDEVESYRKSHSDTKNDYFDRAMSYSRSEPDKALAIMQEFIKWELDNPNPLQNVAEKCLSLILKHFHLEVETDLKKYGPDRGGMYVIIRKEGETREIDNSCLSTGTRQIMLTAMPLFYLKPRDTIILFDQPETSLYPNIQRMLPEVYLKCASDNNQFFFATHSPIVASAFDPWEVIELEFDKDGAVGVRDYCMGAERAKDNYKIYPKLLDWDSSYRILFGVKEEGNEEARTAALMEIAQLGKEIERTKDTNEKDRLFEKYKVLADRVNWKK